MKKIALYISIIIVSVACRKNVVPEPVFPLETQTGANTFGCYVGGKPFIPSTTLYGNVNPIVTFYTPSGKSDYKAGFFSIQGTDARYSLEQAGTIIIQKVDVFGPGEYNLTSTKCANPYDCDSGGYYNGKELKTYFIETGKLTITKLDTVNYIVSGKFNFVAKDTLGNSRTITSGVFDVPYYH